MLECRKLLLLREKIPFLKDIPEHIYFNLDASEFCIPEDDVLEGREDLERKLNQHVMVYDSRVFNRSISIERHLCANLEPAKLNAQQISLLREYEERYKHKNISFVAYKKPAALKPIAAF